MPTPALKALARVLLIGGVGLLAGSKCFDEDVSSFFTDAEWAQIQSMADLPPVSADPTNAVADDPEAAALGKQYYFDPRFSGLLTHADNAIPVSGNGAVGSTSAVSCSRCHNPATGFSDQRTVPDNTSLGSAFTGRNAPTIYNVAYNVWYFWDGRKDTLWGQALGPTESPAEHNGNRVQFAMVIRDHYADGLVTPGGTDHDDVFGLLPAEIALLDATYGFPLPPLAPQFATQGRPGDSADPGAGMFPTYDGLPVNVKLAVDTVFVHFAKAIAAYERLVVSRNSAFDRFAAGDQAAISVEAQRGLRVFMGRGKCTTCHLGKNFTDNLFHNIGLRQLGLHVPVTDEGRFNGVPQVLADPLGGASAFSDDAVAGAAKLAGLVQQAIQHGQFKTSTLREIGETGPYMHTGSIKTLMDVVLFYDRGGDASGFVGVNELVPLGLTAQERDDLVAFMLTLEGEDLPAAVTAPPILPP